MLIVSRGAFCWWLCLFCLSVIALGQKDSVYSRSGHTDKINAVAFSPDGKFLASASSDETLRVWDLTTGTEKWILKSDAEKEETFTAVAFSPDGKILAVGGTYGIKICDAQTGKEIAILADDYVSITSLSFSPNGKMLAVGTGYNTSGLIPLIEFKDKVGIWDMTNFEEIQTFEDAQSPVAFNRAGTLLATANADQTIKLRNPKTGRVTRSIKYEGKINALSFNPTGTVLIGVIGNEFNLNLAGQQIGLWKVINGAKIKIPDETASTGIGLFTPDGKNIVIGDTYPSENGLILLNALNGKPTSGFGLLFEAGDVAAFSPNGKYLAVVDGNGYEMRVYDFQNKSLFRTLKGHSINVVSLAFTEDGKNVLGGYDDGTLIWWETATAKAKTLVSVPKDENLLPLISGKSKLFISPDGKYFADENHGINFFETTGGRRISENDARAEFRYSPDGKMTVSISEETITIREVPSGKILSRLAHQFPEIPYNVWLALSFDNKTLAIAIGSEIVLYNLADGKIVKTLKNVIEEGGIVGFSPDASVLIVSTFFDYKIKAVDLTSGKILFELNQTGPNFAVSRDGKFLATISGYDEQFRLTDLLTGKEILTSEATYDMDSKPVTLALSRDDRLLAVGGGNGIDIFETATGKKIRSMK